MDYVGFHARMRPGKTAIRDLTHGRQWTYSEFDDFVARCVSLLLDKGVEPGERVACLAKNRAEFFCLHLACGRIGAIFVPLNWRLARAEISTLIEDCRPKLIFGDEMAAEKGVSCLDISQLIEQCASVAPTTQPFPPEDLPSLILYTSGTTGKPKGVVMTERNITETALNFILLGDVESSCGFLCESPMFHIIGMITSVRPAFVCGGHVVISDGFIPDRTLSRLADPELNISHYFCVPQMAAALRASDSFAPARLRNLKAVFTGGAPLEAANIQKWLNDGISIVNGYGSTEAGSIFGMPLDREIIACKGSSAGVPTPRVAARVVNGAGEVLPQGEAGELQLKADSIMQGYWNNAEETAKCMTEDGWFCTGDIGTVDAEGFYYIVDRKKDMYISGGENVYPAEVEALLVNYPGIKEFSIVGVPDEKWGEVGCLFYVDDESLILVEDVAEYLSGKLARYKLPQRTLRLESIPRNGAGKILKQELRRIFTEEAR